MQRQDRRADKMRTIHDQRVAIALKLFMPAAPGNASIPGLNGDRMNLLPGDSGDVVRRDAGIDDALMVAVKIDVVDDRGLIENPRYFTCLDAMTSRMRVAEILRCHKREGIRIQAETGTRRCGPGKQIRRQIDKPQRRQWRPATIIFIIAPEHPGRRPGCIRAPAPAIALMMKPATVVKCRPTPGITRNPIPATIGINPMSVVAIRLPAGVVNDNRWPPAPAVALKVHPAAVRREGVVKIIHRDFGRLRRRGFRCFRRRCVPRHPTSRPFAAIAGRAAAWH